MQKVMDASEPCFTGTRALSAAETRRESSGRGVPLGRSSLRITPHTVLRENLHVLLEEGARERSNNPQRMRPPPAPRRPYLLRTSLARMGARRLKEDLASQARGLGGRPGPRLLWARNSLLCRRGLQSV